MSLDRPAPPSPPPDQVCPMEPSLSGHNENQGREDPQQRGEEQRFKTAAPTNRTGRNPFRWDLKLNMFLGRLRASVITAWGFFSVVADVFPAFKLEKITKSPRPSPSPPRRSFHYDRFFFRGFPLDTPFQIRLPRPKVPPLAFLPPFAKPGSDSSPTFAHCPRPLRLALKYIHVFHARLPYHHN